MKLLEKVFGVTGLQVLKVFVFGLLVGVLLLNGWRLSTILLEGRFTGLQLALFVGLPFVLMVVNAYFLVFRFHPAMIYYRLGFVACLLFVRFCLDYSYIYTLDPMAGDPEEVPSFERAAYALAVGYGLVLNAQWNFFQLILVGLPFGNVAWGGLAYYYHDASVCLESSTSVMKAFKPKLLRLLQEQPHLREQIEPLALPLSAEQLVDSEKAAPAVVLAVGTSEKELPFRSKELQAYRHKMRWLFNESGVLRNLYDIRARQNALQGSQEFLKIFTAETSTTSPLQMADIFSVLFPGKTVLERRSFMGGAYIHGTLWHGLTIRDKLTLPWRCSLLESDRESVRPLASWKTAANLWSHSQLIKDNILGTATMLECKELQLVVSHPTQWDTCVTAVDARGKCAVITTEVKRGTGLPLALDDLRAALKDRFAKILDVRKGLEQPQFLPNSLPLESGVIHCVMLLSCSDAELNLINLQLQHINKEVEFKAISLEFSVFKSF